ncbi:MAG: glycosyltransferase [archaeon]
MKILLTAGGGGHTGYAIAIGRELTTTEELIFLVDSGDQLSADRLSKLGDIEKVAKPRSPHTPMWRFALRFLYCSLQSLCVWLKHRPTIIVSTGSNLAIPIAIIGRLLGSKIVNIEDSVRIFSSSKTSRYLDFIASITLLQWREQQKFHPKKGIYVGLLLPQVRSSTRDGPILISPGTFGFQKLYDIAIQTHLNNVVMTVGDLDPQQYSKDGWTTVSRLVGLDDVLSKARVVVTHLGYTAWESINYQVPVVIIPNPAWRRSSVAEMEKVCDFMQQKGFGIYLPHDNMTPEGLENAVHRAESMTVPKIEVGAKMAADRIREVEK